MPGSVLADTGATVVLATSSDEQYPPENILDGNTETFWASTGNYPQELVVTLGRNTNLKTIYFDSYNVKQLLIERSTQNEPVDFEAIADKKLERIDGHLQRQEIKVNGTAKHLRFLIESGLDHFVSVHRIDIDGSDVKF